MLTDNASGIAGMLEIAEYLADQRDRGKLRLRRDILFAAWSGEELGLLGSDYFVKSFGRAAHHSVQAPQASGPESGEKLPAPGLDRRVDRQAAYRRDQPAAARW